MPPGAKLPGGAAPPVDGNMYPKNQGRIIHCAGCTTGGAPVARGPPINCQIFTTLCWRWNVQCRLKRNVTTTKKVVNFLGAEKCTLREKILGKRMRKGPRLMLICPRVVNPALQKNEWRTELAYIIITWWLKTRKKLTVYRSKGHVREIMHRCHSINIQPNKRVPMPYRQDVCLRHCRTIGLVMNLDADVWPWILFVSEMLTHMMNFYDKFQWNQSTISEEISENIHTYISRRAK